MPIVGEDGTLQNTKEGPQQDRPALSQRSAMQEVSRVIASSEGRPRRNCGGKEVSLESTGKVGLPTLYTLGHNLNISRRHLRDGPLSGQLLLHLSS